MKQAMILAAGLGTRLKPLTDTRPKALVEVGGRTLLEIVLVRLINAGFTSVVVNIHHFAQQIIDFLHANNNFSIDIKISDETSLLLETGGAIKKAAPLFSTEAPVLIHNVDILSNINLNDFYNLSRNHAAALMVSHRETSRYLLADSDLRLSGWINTKTGETKLPFLTESSAAAVNSLLLASNGSASAVARYSRYAFSGIHTFSPTLFPYFKEWPERFSIIDFYLSVCGKEDIRCILNPDLRLLDVGKVDSLTQAEQWLSSEIY